MEENRISKYSKSFIRTFKKKNSSFFCWALIFFLVILAFSIYNFLLMPSINLKGSRHVEIGYMEKYKEKGYKASFLGNDITKDVKVSGKVNSKKLGTYDITYYVKEGVFEKKVTRKVKVIDKTAPVIKLQSNEDIYVCPGKKYEEEDFSATDDYDGDVTKNVKVTLSDNKITYTVKDKHGNKSTISRNIIYEDKSQPVITLTGSDTVYMFLGDKYNELGYKATDNCDGDLTSKVKVTNNINNNQLGEYKVTYSVMDEANNKYSIDRKVIVSKRDAPGTIYLTFDDGPRAGTTDVILDILKEEGVKATFFVTNSGPDELIKRAYDEGHTIALHTATHDYGIVYNSVDSYFRDLGSVSDRVKRITGEESKIIRFPGGSSNTISRRYSDGIMSALTKEALARGYRYYDWNLSSGDAVGGKPPTASDIYNNVVSHLSKSRVNMILMHDIKTYTRDALRNIIHYAKENGYTFDKITAGTEMVTQRVNN